MSDGYLRQYRPWDVAAQRWKTENDTRRRKLVPLPGDEGLKRAVCCLVKLACATCQLQRLAGASNRCSQQEFCRCCAGGGASPVRAPLWELGGRFFESTRATLALDDIRF